MRWLPVAALALLAPAAAWILLPGDEAVSEASVASTDSSGSRPLLGVFGSSGGNGATPATRQATARDRADAWTAGAQAPGTATEQVSAGEKFAVAVGGGAAADVETPAPAGPVAGADTLFLTIVGNQTFTSWGRAGDRPPPVDGMTAGAGGAGTASTDQLDDGSGLGSSGGSAFEEAVADAGGAVENPLGEAPQVCPRTLPPGSNQGSADALRNQYGCRYLSGCDVLTQQCTWFYQGQG